MLCLQEITLAECPVHTKPYLTRCIKKHVVFAGDNAGGVPGHAPSAGGRQASRGDLLLPEHDVPRRRLWPAPHHRVPHQRPHVQGRGARHPGLPGVHV